VAETPLARLKGFEKLTNADEALSIFMRALKPKRLPAERVQLENSLGRVICKDVVAPIDLPSFDRSAVDGYAVQAEDTLQASQFKPKTIRLTRGSTVGKGQAKQVWTGNPVPKGADAVVMLEYTRPLKNEIQIISGMTPGENVSKKGEDIKKGEAAVESGIRLLPHYVGLLAALGVTHVDVVQKPKVAILSTGNELVELGEKPPANKIVNSNRFVIAGLCQELGAEPLYLGIARDAEEEIGSKILEGLEKADIVITTGGTSVGIADLVPIVVNKLGKPGVVVHGVAIRPGMPTAVGVLKGKPVFVLSGYPVAATIGFEVFARPTLLQLQGITDASRAMVKATLTKRVAGALGRRVYLRVKAFEKQGEFYAEPVRTRGSGLYSSMTRANGYVIIPEDREGLEKDEAVLVRLFGPLTG
jgi:molybdopterin molybdotransferase